jgi:hypothetical protein
MEMPAEIIDFNLHHIQTVSAKVMGEYLYPYVATFPQELIRQAIDDCLPEYDLPEKMQDFELTELFIIPWAIFNWDLFENFGVSNLKLKKTIAENFLFQYADLLKPEEKKFLRVMNKTYYSFYQVKEVVKDKSIIVEDLILTSMHTIKDDVSSNYLSPGDIIYSRFVTIDNHSIFIGMPPCKLPHDPYYDVIMDFKKWLIKQNKRKPLTGSDLRDLYVLNSLDLFFDLFVQYLEPEKFMYTY